MGKKNNGTSGRQTGTDSQLLRKAFPSFPDVAFQSMKLTADSPKQLIPSSPGEFVPCMEEKAQGLMMSTKNQEIQILLTSDQLTDTVRRAR